ncbi:glycosyltransferase family 4 protein [Paraburkholderia domus]|uniref:glycosyltransferase family 4 protein n=1 Tax=Paraburkholderia domus TaxID=2793075 RepID=UPI001912ADF6|nr:glycosyltransferase [Paraburkholderia domus]MBK5065936.1 glycosyltransferase [Burkholderia sp. R-70199]
MKIVHIISGLGVGGAETTLYNLVRHTRGTDISHVVISLSSINSLADSIRAVGGEVRFLGLDRRIPSLRLFIRLVRWIVELDPDVVQTWMYHADFIGGLAARLARIIPRGRRISHPFVLAWGIHRSEVPTSHSFVLRTLASLCAIASRYIPDLTVCCAEAAYTSHVAFGYDQSRMRVIRNGFDIERFAPNLFAHRELIRLLGVPDYAIIIGIVGRFNPAKDFDNFLSAACLLAGRVSECHFVMIGKDVDRNNKALTTYADTPALRGRVHLLGARSDIPAVMPGFDILCLSSRTEGLPTVVGEAMACGVPCVVTNVGDTAELVGNTGIVVPPADHVALAEALEHMVSMSDTQRRRLGEDARARIQVDFSIDACWTQYRGAYEATGRSRLPTQSAS